MRMKTIKFDEEHVNEGFDTILLSDTVVFTADNTIFHVPEGSIEILKEKGVVL